MDQRKTTRYDSPRIYVASLADYNAGRLHGRWVDADQDADAIRGEIADMLAESREPVAEEFAIHDHDNFAGYSVPEFADVERVAQVARLIVEHGPVFAGLLNHFGGDLDEAKQYMTDGYRGAFDSLAEYATELVEECYADRLKALPEFIRYHIDFRGIADDLELSGDVFTIACDGKLHVFDSHI